MGDKPRAEILGVLESLYRTRDYSDLTLFARDGTRHLVHRALVCPRSQYLYDAVHKEQWREDREGHVSLVEEEPEVIRLLVEYLYLLDYMPVSLSVEDTVSSYGDSSDSLSRNSEYGHVYGASAISAFGGPAHPPYNYAFPQSDESQLALHTFPIGEFRDTYNQPQHRRPKSNRTMGTAAPESSPLATNEPHLTLHARMYAAGHKYGIGGLQALALDKLKIQLTRHWDSPEFAEAIHVVYSTTPSVDKDMREAVADTIGWHGCLLDRPEIEFAIMEINGLAYELLKRSRRAEPEFIG